MIQSHTAIKTLNKIYQRTKELLRESTMMKTRYYLLSTLIQNMIDRFYHQRETGHAQFGFLVLGNPGEGILTMNAIPNDGHGNPTEDNTHPLSPASLTCM